MENKQKVNMNRTLLCKYKELNRPISQFELDHKLKTNRYSLNLSDLHAEHSNCKHLYLCKRFGKKFKELQENNSNKDIGNCSVCWKISHTDFIQRQIAKDLAMEYYEIIKNSTPFTHYETELEKFFHSWLYK